MDGNSVCPPHGSSAGVKIEAFTAGPLAGWAVVTIPEGGVLAEHAHAEKEFGVVLDGLVEVWRHGRRAMVTDERYGVSPGTRHSLRGYTDVRILARLEAASATQVSEGGS